MKKKRKYTIEKKRRIVKCPECKRSKIEGMECYNCKRTLEKHWSYNK
jgi:methionyl-tRNA synthetase